jgi:hypothetical protein
MNRDKLIFKILDLKNRIRLDEFEYEEAVRVNDDFGTGFYKNVIIFRNQDLNELIKNLIQVDSGH